MQPIAARDIRFVLCLAMSVQRCDFLKVKENTHNDLFSWAQEQLVNNLNEAL